MKKISILKSTFIFGAVVDFVIAMSWFLIANGLEIPNILNGHSGSGNDYKLAMFVCGMFMTGWAVILYYGALKPLERKGLLLITAAFLLISVIAEVVFYSHTLGGMGFTIGVFKRVFLVVVFTWIYFYPETNSPIVEE